MTCRRNVADIANIVIVVLPTMPFAALTLHLLSNRSMAEGGPLLAPPFSDEGLGYIAAFVNDALSRFVSMLVLELIVSY